MKQQTHAAALAAFSALHVVALTSPAAVVALIADKGGLPAAHGLDLVLASAAVGVFHAVIVWRRLRAELQRGVSFLSALIAEFDALVVLAVVVTGLLYGVLGGFAPEHSAMINQGWPVIALWVLVLLGAVAVAELARSALLRWLSSGDRPRQTG